MSFENRQFTVNGEMDNSDMFWATIALIHNQAGHTSVGYRIDPEIGMVLYWHKESESVLPFPFGNSNEQVSEFVWLWLKSRPKLTSKPDRWEGYVLHDGHDEEGWKVYCEDWGHVGESPYAFAAVKPIICWYRK